MQKVADIKFLKVYWGHCDYSSDMKPAMDIAFAELEKTISEYLKKGWIMKGDLIENRHGRGLFGYILQTMVKYETTKEVELLTF